MKQERVNLKIVTDIRRSKSDERFPLKLRITYKGERRYYATGYDASDIEWNVINSPDAKGNLRKIKNAIAEIENNAQKCCQEIIPFSFRKFENDFFDRQIEFQNVESAFNAYINRLNNNNQAGTVDAYKTALIALKRFKGNLKFDDVTPEFLQSFENWMIGRGRSITTVGFYLRSLRAIMNIAKEKQIIKPQSYPFGRRKYTIPTGRNIKKALGIQQIKQVFDYQTNLGTGADKARDFWVLSYLCNGINMMDLVQLQWKDVNISSINFIREKTKRVNKANPVTITVPRNAYIDKIITKWAIKSFESNDYIFDIIAKNDFADVIRNKAKQFTRVTNKWMKRIGEDLGFDFKLTTYVARHSFATILVRSGAPMKLASQSLGHLNLSTTERYFAGFDLEAQAEFNKSLINF
jgi:site-specific recombinase XerD